MNPVALITTATPSSGFPAAGVLEGREEVGALEQVRELVEGIERRLREARAPVPECVDVAGAMEILGCGSQSAFYREAEAIGLRPYFKGKYRIATIKERVARASYNAERRARAKVERLAAVKAACGEVAL